MQFSIREMLAAIAVVGIVAWLGRLGPPMLFTLVAFFVFVVCPVLMVGQPDAVKSVLVYVMAVVCFGGFCVLLAELMLTYF